MSRSLKALVLAIGRTLTALTGMVGAAVLSRMLTETEYGTWRQTRLAYELIAPFLMLGLPKALMYFIPREDARARGVLLEHLTVLMASAVVFVAFLASVGPSIYATRFDNPALLDTLILLAPYPLFAFPMATVSACLVARDKVQWSAMFEVLAQAMILGTVIFAAVMWRTPQAAVAGLVAGTGAVALPALWLMLKSTAGTESGPRLGHSWLQLKYAVPLGLATMLGTFSRKLDQTIVSATSSAAEAAVYFNGAFELPLIGAITGSITAVLLPDMTRMFAEGRTGELLGLWQRAMAKAMLVMAPAMVGVLLFAPEMMRLLFSATYAESAEPFRVYALLLPARAAVYGAVVMAAGRPRIITWLTAAMLVVNGGLSVGLVWWLGPVGAAWGTVISTWLVVMAFLVVIGRLLGVNTHQVIHWASVGPTVGWAVLAGLPVWGLLSLEFVASLPDLVRLMLGAGVYGLLVLAVWQWTGRVQIKAIIQMIQRRLKR